MGVENRNELNRPEAPKKVPEKTDLERQHQQIMQNFDEIPINKIKTMVGYQTEPYMYTSDMKHKDSQQSMPEVPEFPQEVETPSDLPLEERVQDTVWKVRQQAFKEINQQFYNDYAQNQSDPEHPMFSFD